MDCLDKLFWDELDAAVTLSLLLFVWSKKMKDDTAIWL